MKSMKPLADIFRDHATPKGEYPPVYEMVLGHLRQNGIRLLEIGIGTMLEGAHSNMRSCALPGYKPGASLRAWNEYFTNPYTKIFGIDKQPDTQFIETGIITFLCDSTSKEDTQRLFENLNLMTALGIGLDGRYVDIIIDDASHVPADIFKTMDNFYPLLKPGGYYFIEDIANTGITLEMIRGHLQPDDLLFIAGEVWKIAVIKKQNS